MRPTYNSFTKRTQNTQKQKQKQREERDTETQREALQVKILYKPERNTETERLKEREIARGSWG